MINIKKLPHSAVPLNSIKDPAVRSIVMRLNENVLSLSGQLSELQREVLEMQRKKV